MPGGAALAANDIAGDGELAAGLFQAKASAL
jgi:hypothetical protein